MSATTDRVSSYERQVSDTFFYNKAKRDRSRGRQNGHRALSFTEPEWKTRNGSMKERQDDYHITNETSGEFNNKYLKSGESGRVNSRKGVGYYNESNKVNSDQQSENIVRFHKDLVTDVLVDYRHKIQVDNLESSFPGKSAVENTYDTDIPELIGSRGEKKGSYYIPDKSRHHIENGKSASQQVSRQNTHTKFSETCFSVEGDVSENTKRCGNTEKSGTENKRRGMVSSCDRNTSKSRNGKEDRQCRTSSRKTAGSLTNSKAENCPRTKSTVKKTRSSCSTGSNHNDNKKATRTSSYSKSSTGPQAVLTKSNSNGYATRTQSTSENFDEKLILAYSSQNSDTMASTKRRKVFCVLLVFLATAVIVVAVTTGLVFVVGKRESTEGAADRPRVYDMLNVHVRLKVLNKNYTVHFKNSSSPHFNSFSVQICNEIDVIYITSHMSQSYYGCEVLSLSSGSVQVYFVSPFLDTPQTSNISYHREILLNNLRSIFSLSLPVNTTVLGDFVVDVNSIEISIEKFQATVLPQKPRLPFRATSTMSTSAVLQKSQNNAISTSTNSPSNDKETIASEREDDNVINNTVHTTKMSKSTTATTQNAIQQAMTISDVGSQAYSITKQSGITFTPTSKLENATSLQTYNTNDAVNRTLSTPRTSTDRAKNDVIKGNIIDGQRTDGKSVSGQSKDEKSFHNASLYKATITAKNESVYLDNQPAALEFSINNSRNLVSLVIRHKNFRGVYSKVKELPEQEMGNQGKIKYTVSPERILSVEYSENSIHVCLEFKTVTCDDVGVYICSVKDKNGFVSVASGNLIGTAEPGMPQLTLPIALVENKEIKQPIMCTADVGFPNGRLEWKIKPKGSSEFLPFPGHFVSKSGHCDNYVTNSLIYTPTKDGNGTLLKCEVVNDNVPHPPDLTAVADLYILPENMCDGVKKGKTIRHPFTCTKYIRCHENSFDVKECGNGMCYDEESGRCGQTKIRMNDVVAYLNEGVTSLQCRLDHLGQWTNVTISKEGSDGRWERVVSVISGGNDVIVHDTNMKDRIFVHTESTNEFELKLNLWLYVLTCADEGLYRCEAYTPSDFKEVTGKIDLRGKPEPPKIVLPNEIIEDLPLRRNVTCQANVGYPQGRLVLKMKLHNETEFHQIIYNVTSEETMQNCSKILRKSFTFTPALSHEKMELLCEVENRFTLPVNRKLGATETIHVVPKNFCLTHGSKTPQVHPYDCHQYVQCSEGYTYVQRCGSDHCFNPHTLHCDIVVEDKDITFDPKHPCLPDKNGVFYHHPILCNKYIWCVQGQEVVHHCPLGTLYIDGGQCTFEPERSRCYQNLNKDSLSP